MNLEKLYQDLKQLSNKPVFIIVKGAIEIPFTIKKFEFREYESYISFGEFEDEEETQFNIDKDNIHEIFHNPMLNDEFGETFHVSLKLMYGDFVTFVTILAENLREELV
jgi:hypothetical protein